MMTFKNDLSNDERGIQHGNIEIGNFKPHIMLIACYVTFYGHDYTVLLILFFSNQQASNISLWYRTASSMKRKC